MEIIDMEDEFKPLDEERIEFVVGLAIDIKEIADRAECLTDIEKQIIRLASHQMMVMTSMTLAGYDLYSSHMQHADALYSDAATMMKIIQTRAPHVLNELNLTAMDNWQSYLKTVEIVNNNG